MGLTKFFGSMLGIGAVGGALTPLEAVNTLADYRIIDVRGAGEFNGPLGNIAGSELVPLEELPRQAPNWDKSQALLMVCRSGARSAMASQLLESMEFTGVVNLSGGMMAWNQAGLPVNPKARKTGSRG